MEKAISKSLGSENNFPVMELVWGLKSPVPIEAKAIMMAISVRLEDLKPKKYPKLIKAIPIGTRYLAPTKWSDI